MLVPPYRRLLALLAVLALSGCYQSHERPLDGVPRLSDAGPPQQDAGPLAATIDDDPCALPVGTVVGTFDGEEIEWGIGSRELRTDFSIRGAEEIDYHECSSWTARGDTQLTIFGRPPMRTGQVRRVQLTCEETTCVRGRLDPLGGGGPSITFINGTFTVLEFGGDEYCAHVEGQFADGRTIDVTYRSVYQYCER